MKRNLLIVLMLMLCVSITWAWPGSTVDTTDVDQSTDDPSQARVDIYDSFQKLNTIINDRGAANGVASLDGSGDVPTAQLPAATSSAQGAVELATDAETQTGTDTTRAITPANHVAFHGRGALAYHNANQSIANNTTTVISFNSEDHDSDTIHDNATNNSRLTVPSGASRIQLFGQVRIATGASGYSRAAIRKNGSTTWAGAAQELQGTPGSSLSSYLTLASPEIDVSASDYFEIEVYQNSGSSQNVIGSSGQYTWFSMKIIE